MMKQLHFLQVLLLCLVLLSCSSDENESSNSLSGDPGIEATINGGTYNNYLFDDGIYSITLGNNGQTLRIDAGDPNGDTITIFLNGTSGFSNGVVKEIGNVDADNFMTYFNVRQASTQLSYFANSGEITIVSHKAHPDKSGYELISGTFDISATTGDQSNSLSMSGSFIDLEYQK